MPQGFGDGARSAVQVIHGHVRADGGNHAVDVADAVDEFGGVKLIGGHFVEGQRGAVGTFIALDADGMNGQDEALFDTAGLLFAGGTETADGEAGSGERMAVERLGGMRSSRPISRTSSL